MVVPDKVKICSECLLTYCKHINIDTQCWAVDCSHNGILQFTWYEQRQDVRISPCYSKKKGKMFSPPLISTIIEIFSRQISPARSTTHSTYPTDLTVQIRSMITTLHTLSISLPISPVQTRCTPSPSALFSRFDSHVPHRFSIFFLRCRC